MMNAECKKMGVKCLIPLVAVFATIFLFEWLFHGVYMMPAYEATASQWRPEEEMQGLWPYCLITKLVMAAVICCLYCMVSKGCESQGRCYKKGAKFGFKIGLLLGVQQFSSYLWLPIELGMALNWLIGNIIMGVLIGLVLAFVTGFCKKGECGVK